MIPQHIRRYRQLFCEPRTRGDDPQKGIFFGNPKQ